MKIILQVVKGIDIGGHNGGAEIFGIRLSRELARQGENVTLCAFFQYNTSCETDWERVLLEDGVQVIYACKPLRGWLIEAFRNLKAFLSQERIEIIHSHYQIGTIYAILFKALKKVRYVIRTAHTPVEFGEGVVASVMRFFFIAIIYPWMVTREIGVSEEIISLLNRRWLARALKKTATMIHITLPEKKIAQDQKISSIRSEAGNKDEWVITTIGILRPFKNVAVLIRAIPGIVSKISNCRFLIVGDGPERETLQSLAQQLGISEYVEFLGQRSDISEILANTDLFIHPSRIESISTVMLEAIRQGVPVVASDIPGHQELITDRENGWLYPLHEPDKLVDFVIEALECPELRIKFAKAAFSRLDDFSSDQIVQNHQNIYRLL